MYIITKDLTRGQSIRHLKIKFENINSKTSVIISDHKPLDPSWIKIQPSDLMQYIYSFDVWYKRKIEIGHLCCYVRPPKRSISKLDACAQLS